MDLGNALKRECNKLDYRNQEYNVKFKWMIRLELNYELQTGDYEESVNAIIGTLSQYGETFLDLKTVMVDYKIGSKSYTATMSLESEIITD